MIREENTNGRGGSKHPQATPRLSNPTDLLLGPLDSCDWAVGWQRVGVSGIAVWMSW